MDQMFSLAQREAVIKNLKKEVTQAKISLAKTKAKNKELKVQVSQMQNQENQQANSNKFRKQGVADRASKIGANRENVIDEQVDKQALKLAQVIMTEESGGYKGVLDQLQKTNSVLAKFVEMQAELEKTNNWNMVVSQ